MQDLFMALIVIFGFSLIFMTIFGYFAYVRYLSHKETMALAEKGLLKPEHVVQYNGGNGRDRKLLNRAIMLIALGFALCLGLFPIGFVAGDDFPFFLGPWMIAGFLPLFFGIALCIFPAVVVNAQSGSAQRVRDDTRGRIVVDLRLLRRFLFGIVIGQSHAFFVPIAVFDRVIYIKLILFPSIKYHFCKSAIGQFRFYIAPSTIVINGG